MLHISAGVEALSGHASAAFIGDRATPYSAVIHPDDLVAVYEQVDAALSKRASWDIDYRIAHRLGEPIWVQEIGAGVFDAKGNLLYLEGFVFDIRRRKAAEAQLNDTQQRLLDTNLALTQSLVERSQALAFAEKANDAKSSFLAIMNHELRTPLNAIIGFADLMKQEAFGRIESDRYREYVAEISDAGYGLLTVVNNMLELTQLTNGRRSLDIEPIGLPQIWKATISDLVVAAATKQISLLLDPRSSVREIAGDRGAIVRVLQNILRNSIKFCPAGSAVTVSAEHDADQGRVVLSVVDRGPGIAAEQLKDIARPFSPGARSYTRAAGGVGLGLAICRALVIGMRGTLEIQSEVGEGTRVLIALPEWHAD
jgi:PAS domain S-box-containing protein